MKDGYPKEYPVYMEKELEEICRIDITNGTLKLVHEAKKLAGARVVNEDRGG